MVKKPLKLIYVIGTYPSLSTTFIDREVKIFREWGVDLQVLAVRQPRAGMPLSKDQKALQKGVTYLAPIPWLAFLISQLYFATLRPKQYFGTLYFLLSRPHPPEAKARYFSPRFMTLLHFLVAVYGAYLIRNNEFEELHSHFVDRAATIALTIGRLLDKPYSVSIHAGPDIFVNPVLLNEKITEARYVATCTAYNKTHVEKIVGKDLSHKMSHLHHGLDLTKYQPNSVNGNKTNEKFRIVSVGQLFERKGFVYLIKACGLLKDQGYSFSCHIVGDGPQRTELDALINQLSLDETVILHGAMSHDEVIQHYQLADMFVLPCIQSKDGNLDGIPNVLAEALAMELPSVSTDISGVPELITDRVNGLLIPPGDEQALAKAMAKVIDDPALREKLIRNGRQSVLEDFDVNKNVRQFATTLWPAWFQD